MMQTLPGVTQPDPNTGRGCFTATVVACPRCGAANAGESRGWYYCGTCLTKGPWPA